MRRTLRYRSNVSDIYKEDNSARRIYPRRPFPVISMTLEGIHETEKKHLRLLYSVKYSKKREQLDRATIDLSDRRNDRKR
jgi:hypothetical protein